MDAQKQTLSAAERDEAAARDPAAVLFLDETSTRTGFPRLRVRAPCGERAPCAAPPNRGPNVTLLAVLGPRGIGTSVAIPGAATRAVFDAFVAQFLVPCLRPGQTVVRDNLSVHQSATAQALGEAAGGRLRFLPAYSPGFDPIAPIFAKIKTALRAAAACSPEALLAATKATLDAVTAQGADGCYAACGVPCRCNQNQYETRSRARPRGPSTRPRARGRRRPGRACATPAAQRSRCR